MSDAIKYKEDQDYVVFLEEDDVVHDIRLSRPEWVEAESICLYSFMISPYILVITNYQTSIAALTARVHSDMNL